MVKKKKKKKVIKVKNIIILLIILLTIITSCYYALTMPIKNIYIKNNKLITDDEIMSSLSLYEYPSFLLTNKSQIEKTLKQNKYIKNVKVTKKFKNIIEITIYEYKQVAMTKEERLILENGNIIENNYPNIDIPIIINQIENDKIFKTFCNKFGQIEKNILRQISEIEYSPVEVDEERLLLYMNDGNLVYITLTKIDKINKYNKIKDKLEGKNGIIYLDSGNFVELKKQQ